MVAMTIPRLVIHMVACPVRCVIVGLAGPVVSGGRGRRQFQQYPIASMVILAAQLLQLRVMVVTSVSRYSMRETGLPSM